MANEVDFFRRINLANTESLELKNTESCWRLLVPEHLTRYVYHGLTHPIRLMPQDSIELIGLQIGLQHGNQAKDLVHGSIQFYDEYFMRNSKMAWSAAENAAAKFLPFLEQHVPHLVEEMQGEFLTR